MKLRKQLFLQDQQNSSFHDKSSCKRKMKKQERQKYQRDSLKSAEACERKKSVRKENTLNNRDTPVGDHVQTVCKH